MKKFVDKFIDKKINKKRVREKFILLYVLLNNKYLKVKKKHNSIDSVNVLV